MGLLNEFDGSHYEATLRCLKPVVRRKIGSVPRKTLDGECVGSPFIFCGAAEMGLLNGIDGLHIGLPFDARHEPDGPVAKFAENRARSTRSTTAPRARSPPATT